MAKDDFRLASALSLARQLGFDIVLPILITAWIGRYLDNRFFSGKYILTLILPLFGGFFSIWTIYKMIVPLMDKELPEDKKGDKEAGKSK